MANVHFDFSGRSAIVTGAARGIGLEIARSLQVAGADVTMVDLETEVLEANAREVGARCITADVSKSDDVARVVDYVVAESGRVDILINNAGIFRDTVLWKLTDDDWDTVLAVHAGGTFRFTRACVPTMRAQNYGRIINVTSYTGLRGNIGQANYSTAKAGIIGFTKTAAKELARFGITVNAISPNAETRMVASIPQAKREELLAVTPLGRFADPSEIAAAVAFLVSEEAGYITGIVVPIDGGISI